MVKDPPAMRETWVQSLGWEDPLGEGMATHSSMLAWRIPVDRRTWWVAELDMTERLSTAASKDHDPTKLYVILEKKFILK